MTTDTTPTAPDRAWYKYGVATLFAEMFIAVSVCAYSLSMAFLGMGGFPGKG